MFCITITKPKWVTLDLHGPTFLTTPHTWMNVFFCHKINNDDKEIKKKTLWSLVINNAFSRNVKIK